MLGSEQTLISTRNVESPDPIFPPTGRRVVPIEQTCRIALIFSTEWIPTDTDLAWITPWNKNEEEEIARYRMLTRDFDPQEIPLDRIAKEFCVAVVGYSRSWLYGAATGGLLKQLPNVNCTFVAVDKPELRTRRSIHDEWGFHLLSCHIIFKLYFHYHVTNFYKDAGDLTDKLTNVLRGLYNWKNFHIETTCSFQTSNYFDLVI